MEITGSELYWILRCDHFSLMAKVFSITWGVAAGIGMVVAVVCLLEDGWDEDTRKVMGIVLMIVIVASAFLAVYCFSATLI